MTYSFNLVDRKWIPCVRQDGRVALYSLRETLLQADSLSGLHGDSPLETGALYRLLLAVLHSALRGPGGQKEWSRLWVKDCWEPALINGYLERWFDRFDLFDPQRPFYQAADERVKEKSIISLVMDMASGNNGVLFDHHTELEGTALTADKAARTLLVAQTFGLAGLSGLEQKFTDGVWGRGIIFLVEGENLFQSLALNLLRYPDEKVFQTGENDLPAWESDDPFLPARQVPLGYLDYLTWQNRRVLLFPQDSPSAPCVRSMTVAPGLRLDGSILDPLKLYRAGKKEGYICTRFSEDRLLWRDSASLFSLRGNRGYFPPKTFQWLADLVSVGMIPKQQPYRFLGLGMANDQARVDFFQEQHLPLPLSYLENDELVEQLASALDLAEQVAYAQRISSQLLALLVASPGSDDKQWNEVDRTSKGTAVNLAGHWNGERFFWQQLEVPFLNFLSDLPNQPGALKTWQETVRRVAWDALELAAAAAGTDAAALKAAVRARARLGYLLKELFREPKKEVTV